MFDDASGPTRLSGTATARLIQSTGNLYWSSNPPGDVGVPGQVSAIFRASKSSHPGEEIQLYAESNPSFQIEFGALTFAKVDNEFYGYFVANYDSMSQIKRIPLAGGPACVVLAESPAIGAGDLVTDGSVLCWADHGGIRSMPIGGGLVTTLVAGTGFERLSVLGTTLYYVDGMTILGVPTSGGTPTKLVAEQLSPITALYALAWQPPIARAEQPENPWPIVQDVALVWGTADGAVYGKFPFETTTLQAPAADTTVVCVFSTRTRVLWSDQYFGQEGPRYRVRMAYGGVTTTLSSEIAYLSNRDVLADEIAAYWTDSYVEKYTF